MPLSRQQSSKPKPPREPHECIPIIGERGRFMVKSASAAKRGEDEGYIVDIFEVEQTNIGPVTGTCPCKGWSVRKTCSHLDDSRDKFAAMEAAALGFPKLA